MASSSLRDAQPSCIYRFDAFEVRVNAGLLLYKGTRVRIQVLPFRLLLVLLENCGEVVSREELRLRLWDDRTFVEFDNNLRVAAAKLREALRDSATDPQFFETVARRGYRFVGKVACVIKPETPFPSSSPALQAIASSAESSLVPTASFEMARRWPLTVSLLIPFAVLAAALTWWTVTRFHRPLVTSKDMIVLGSIENKTGNPVYDDALSLPFRVKMEESPYLRLISTERLLRAMQNKPVASLEGELQACRQLNGQLLIAGELRSAGRDLAVGVAAYECANGKEVASQTAKAESPEALLAALGQVSERMRLRLGETSATLQRFDVPLTQATTKSLAALRAFQIGEQMHVNGHGLESETYYKMAIDLDPQFALAYLQLGRGYSNSGEMSLSREYYQKAFDLRERTTDREKLYITTGYYGNVTGEIDRTIQAFELWSSLYPNDVVPANNLATEYNLLGQPDKAVVSARRAVDLDPSLDLPYSTLAWALLKSGDYATLSTLCKNKVRSATSSILFHMTCYQAAFARGDEAAMQRELVWSGGNPQEASMLDVAGEIAFYQGRILEGKRLFSASRDSARANNLPELATDVELNEAEFLGELGFVDESRRLAQEAIGLAPKGTEIDVSLAIVWALTGDAQKARSALAKAANQQPLGTILNQGELPAVEAVIDVKTGHPKDAIHDLESSRPFDLCHTLDLMPPYYRGLAYSEVDLPAQAAAEFRSVVDHRSINPQSPFVPLATMGLAKALLHEGQNAAAMQLIHELKATWRNADPNFPPLHELRSLSAQTATDAGRRQTPNMSSPYGSPTKIAVLSISQR